MSYRNELFYRLYSIGLNRRAQLYHYACKLAQNNVVVVSVTDMSCSIWVSLRSVSAIAYKADRQDLATAMELCEDGTE